jgi:hypothetical protein
MEDSIYQASASDVSIHGWITRMLLYIAAKGHSAPRVRRGKRRNDRSLLHNGGVVRVTERKGGGVRGWNCVGCSNLVSAVSYRVALSSEARVSIHYLYSARCITSIDDGT